MLAEAISFYQVASHAFANGLLGDEEQLEPYARPPRKAAGQ
jgi:hypothetical protein